MMLNTVMHGEEFFDVLDDAAPGFRWLDLYADGTVETGIVRLD